MKKFFLIIFITGIFMKGSFGQTEVSSPGINLENYVYPYPVNFVKLHLQGESLSMAFMDVKPRNPNGKVIMLLHGKNFCGAYWEQTAHDLAENGYRVIIPDQIGFGKSSKPNHLQYSFQFLAQNTKLILDSLHISKTAVLGHSMGGMLATRFTLMYPDVVEKLILEDPIGLEDWKVKVPYSAIDDGYKSELNQDYAKIRAYQQKNYYHGEWKPSYDRWVNLLAGWTKDKDYPKIAWNAALTSDMIFTQPVCYEFENISVPTLLIIGQKDRTALGKNLVSEGVASTMGNYPELGKQTARKIKNSQLVEIEDAGHLPHIETYAKFIQPLLQFLSR